MGDQTATSVSGYPAEDGYRLTVLAEERPGADCEARQRLTAEQARALLEQAKGKGRRPICVFVCPDFGQTSFGLLLVANPTRLAWEARLGLTVADYRREAGALAARGYRPEQVVGYDQPGGSRYLGVWVKE
jgi:hypothetical protein